MTFSIYTNALLFFSCWEFWLLFNADAFSAKWGNPPARKKPFRFPLDQLKNESKPSKRLSKKHFKDFLPEGTVHPQIKNTYFIHRDCFGVNRQVLEICREGWDEMSALSIIYYRNRHSAWGEAVSRRNYLIETHIIYYNIPILYSSSFCAVMMSGQWCCWVFQIDFLMLEAPQVKGHLVLLCSISPKLANSHKNNIDG